MIDYKVTTTTREKGRDRLQSRAPTSHDATRHSTGHGVGDFLFVPTLTWIAHVKLYGVHYIKYTVQYEVQKDRTTQIYTHARET